MRVRTIALWVAVAAMLLIATWLVVRDTSLLAHDRNHPIDAMQSDWMLHAPPSKPEHPARMTVAPEAATPSTKARVNGRVIDANRQPLAGAHAACAREGDFGGCDDVPVAADGRFDVSVEIAEPGEYELLVWHTSFVRHRQQVLLSPGEARDVGDIVLEPAAMVRGRVTDASGYAIAGAEVAATPAEPVRAVLNQTMATVWPKEVEFSIASLTRADQDGQFTLDALPPGDYVLWARRSGYFPAHANSIELMAGQPRDDVTIVLSERGDAGRIDGIVLDPDGNGVLARISYRVKVTHGLRSSITTDRDGRFTLDVQRDGAHDMEAIDCKGLFQSDRKAGVLPGTKGLVFQLQRPRTLRLHVHSPTGPVPEYFALAEDPDHHGLLNPLPPSALDGYDAWQELLRAVRGGQPDLYHYPFLVVAGDQSRGNAELPVPDRPFRVWVEAHGYQFADLGPFDPSRLPAVLDVLLESLPGVHGRVVENHQPVAGATVSLHREMCPRCLISCDVFRVRSSPEPVASAITGEDGTFGLDLRQAGSYYVRAVAKDHAPAEIGPLALDERAGAADLEIGVGVGGALEGVVKVHDGVDPRSITVAISRGDGFPQYQTADADGHYLFERLAPGPWLVRDVKSAPFGSVSRGFAPANHDDFADHPPGFHPPVPLRWSCTVSSDRTTQCNLDLTQPWPSVRGVFLLNGHPADDWSVSLQSADYLEQDEPGTVAKNTDGSFAITTREAGRYTLAIRCRIRGDAELHFTEVVEITAGERAWRCDLPVGSIEGQIPADATKHEDLWVVHRWRARGAQTIARVRPDASGHFALPVLAAGPGQLYCSTSRDPEQGGFAVEVRADAKLVIESWP